MKKPEVNEEGLLLAEVYNCKKITFSSVNLAEGETGALLLLNWATLWCHNRLTLFVLLTHSRQHWWSLVGTVMEKKMGAERGSLTRSTCRLAKVWTLNYHPFSKSPDFSLTLLLFLPSLSLTRCLALFYSHTHDHLSAGEKWKKKKEIHKNKMDFIFGWVRFNTGQRQAESNGTK